METVRNYSEIKPSLEITPNETHVIPIFCLKMKKRKIRYSIFAVLSKFNVEKINLEDIR